MESTVPKEEDSLINELIDKTKKNTRGVPTMNFIEKVEPLIDKYTSEKLISYLNQYLNKFKYMEAQISKQSEAVKGKIPDMEKCLETIDYMEKKDKNETLKIDYMVSNNLWAKADVKVPESVFLWLGANIMCEYSMSEAKELLNSNLEKAKSQIKVNENDLDFVKDQMTCCEVNIARIYNESVRRKQAAGAKQKV